MPRVLFSLGLLLLVVTWCGPLPQWAAHSFAAHMAMHMSVVAVAAPLLACGLVGTRFEWLRTMQGGGAAIVASLVELVIVWAWHAPALHHFARHTRWGLWVEQATFLVSGLLLWLTACGGRREQARVAAGVVALLLTTMHMTLLGALLALTPRPLYAHTALDNSFATLTPLDDQQFGGALMLFVGGTVYLAGGLWLTRDLLRHRLNPAGGKAC